MEVIQAVFEEEDWYLWNRVLSEHKAKSSAAMGHL